VKQQQWTYHIRRCKVAHDKIVLVRPDDLRDFIRDALHTHLGQFVIRRDFRRIDHVSFLPIELLLDASIEEERDMCVLFRLYVGKVSLLIQMHENPIRV